MTRLGVLSDVHLSANPGERGAWHNPYDFAGTLSRVEQASHWFRSEGVDAVALLGDLVHRGDPLSMRNVLDRFAPGETPACLVLGNHDVSQDIAAIDDVVRASVGIAAASLAGNTEHGVRVAGVHVQAPGWFGASLRDQPATSGWSAEPVVLLSHYPLLSRAARLAELGWPYPGDLLDRATVEEALVRRPGPTVVLSGHIHFRDVHISEPVLQLSQGASIEPPFDAAIVSVESAAGAVIVTRRTLRLNGGAARREPVLAEAEGSWRFDGEQWAEL